MQETSQKVRRYKQSIVVGALIGFGAAIIFAAGFLFRGFVNLETVSAASQVDELRSYPLLDEVQILLDQHYLRQQPSVSERQYAAIRGILGALNDRYTFLIDPPVAQSESDVLAGTYGGIGVQVRRSEVGDFVIYPFPESPAAAAGIEDGDIILAINAQSIAITQQQDAIDQMLRGEVKEGNGVELTVRKQGQGRADELSVFIPFSVINVPSVIWRTVETNLKIGYIQIILFTSRTPEETRAALESLWQEQITGLILDLRNNGGGLLKESVAVASQFLDRGVVVYEKNNQEEHVLEAEGGGIAVDLPLVVLINQRTASAAELVAGAIRDRDRGILIGQTTYGKGTVQQIYRLSDDSSLHITSAEWFTPSRTQIDGTGLEPNISMIPDENGRDVEMGEAVRQLEAVILEQGS